MLFRSFASKGIVDIIYIDRDGIGHLEQLKFSSVGRPRVSKKEREDLQRFADRFRGMSCHVSLVLKQSHKPAEVIRLNAPETANLPH